VIQKNFAGVIKEAIKESGLSLRAFAKQCSIDSSYLSKVLKGKRNPPAEEETIAQIANFISMAPEQLMFICGRIPSRFQKLFLRSDIFEILERLPSEGEAPKPAVKNKIYSHKKGNYADEHTGKKPVFKRQNLPDEIL